VAKLLVVTPSDNLEKVKRISRADDLLFELLLFVKALK
jgi:hypothetical protein